MEVRVNAELWLPSAVAYDEWRMQLVNWKSVPEFAARANQELFGCEGGSAALQI